MPPQPATIAALLCHGRDLLAQIDFDIEQALKWLHALPTNDLDHQECGSIKHAKRAVADSLLDAQTIPVARFALARVIVLLERHVALGLP